MAEKCMTRSCHDCVDSLPSAPASANSSSSVPHLHSSFLTVFGFTSSSKYYVLEAFEKYGHILQYIMDKDTNYMHICYEDSAHARQALKRDGKLLNTKLMIGVKNFVQDEEVQEQLSGAQLKPTIESVMPQSEFEESHDLEDKDSLEGVLVKDEFPFGDEDEDTEVDYASSSDNGLAGVAGQAPRLQYAEPSCSSDDVTQFLPSSLTNQLPHPFPQTSCGSEMTAVLPTVYGLACGQDPQAAQSCSHQLNVTKMHGMMTDSIRLLTEKNPSVLTACKTCIPEVSKSVRKAYSSLRKNAETSGESNAGATWTTDEPYSSPRNQIATEKVIVEVGRLFGDVFPKTEILKSCRSHWNTIQSHKCRTRNQTLERHSVATKLNSRLRTKMAKRLSAADFEPNWNEEKRRKVKEVLSVAACHSSEDSDPETDMADCVPVRKDRISKWLPWESCELRRCKDHLDMLHYQRKSLAAQRITARVRKVTQPSSRPRPAGLPRWAYADAGPSSTSNSQEK